MPEYCPKCENEVLPYLKTGELKEVVDGKLVRYQLWWCLKCKVIYYEPCETHEFVQLRKEKVIKKDGIFIKKPRREDAITSKKRKISS